MDGTVSALAVSGSDIYAGGSFVTAGGTTVNRIAKWNGSVWAALGTGMNNTVLALAVSGSDLYAGGSFTTSAFLIGKWNGSAWSGFSSVPNSTVVALAVSGSNLYAGGAFTETGVTGLNHVAKWNGSAWSALGREMNDLVTELAISGSDLYVGGLFNTVGGTTVNYIAKWNGSVWSGLGSGMNAWVNALTVSGGNLYAAGNFTTAGGVSVNRIAKWNGSTWSALGSGIIGASALAVIGSDLYAGGTFTTAGGTSANNIAKWNGSVWSALGTGMDSTVSALAVSGSDLYAGGAFTTAGGVAVNRIAKWDGIAWSALGTGMDSTVSALAVTGSDLYAGGAFTTAGGVTVNRIAKWDGSTWSALGSGMSSSVSALAVSGSDLYAGGGFTTAGGVTVNRIAKWDGSAWSALGTGMNSTVSALAADNVGHLYAGGAFFTAGTTISPFIAQANLNGGTPDIAVVQATLLADGGNVAFGTVAPSASSTKTFTISNLGTGDLTDLVVTKDGANMSDFSISALSATGIPVGSGTAIFTVTFAPSSGGTKTAGMHIASNDPDENPFDINLTGTGAGLAPEIAVEQPVGINIVDGGSRSFGNVNVGSSTSLTFTIMNIGTADLTGLTITKDGTDTAMFTVTVNPIAPVSGPSGSTTFAVQFAPTSAGARTAAIHIASNDSDENPFDVTLTGIGVGPEIGVNGIPDGGSISFGNVGVSYAGVQIRASGTFTITNTGLGDLTGLTTTIDGADSALFTITASPTAPVPGPSGSTTFTLSFGTTSLGPKTAALHIANNDSDENPYDIFLSATGIASDIAVEQPVGIDIADGGGKAFGTVAVGDSADLSFTIKNIGNIDLTGLGITIDGVDATMFAITANPTAPVSSPNGSTSFTVCFAPTSGGAKTAALHIASNDPDENPFDIVVTGIGLSNDANLSNLTLSSGSLNPGFASGTTSYSATVLYSISSITVTPTVANANATVRVNGVAVASGSASGSLAVAYGDNAINIVVTAQDQVTTKTYALTVARRGPGKHLLISGGDMSSTIQAYLTTLGHTSTIVSPQNFSGTSFSGYDAIWLGESGAFTGLSTRQNDLIAFVNLGGVLLTEMTGAENPLSDYPYGSELAVTGINEESVHIVDAASAVNAGLIDVDLSNWSNSFHRIFTTTGSFHVLSVKTGTSNAVTLEKTVGAGRIVYTGQDISGHVNSGTNQRARFLDNIIRSGMNFVPEIVLEQPIGTNIPAGGSKSFGSVVVGANTSLTFTIKNTGNANLTGLTITKDGTDAAMFTITANPTAPVSGPNGGTTFTVRFAPTSAGVKTAAIHIASNDADENPFDITLTGTGIDPYATPTSLVITGPTICAADTSVQFQAWAQYGASSVDVTAQAIWTATGAALSYEGLGRVVLSGNRLTSGAFVPDGEKIFVTATYQPYDRITSPPFEVVTGDGNSLAVGISLGVGNGQYLRPEGGGYVWRVLASAYGKAVSTPGVVWDWTIDGTTRGTASTLDVEVAGAPRTVELRITAADGQGGMGGDRRLISLQRPALNEVGQKYHASQPAGVSFVDGAGNLFQFDATRITHGLIILTHGINNGPNVPWIRGLSNAIASRLDQAGKPVPNIVIYGWEDGANPFLKDLGSTDLNAVARSLKVNSAVLATMPWVGDFIHDVSGIKPDAKGYGMTLANWVKAEAALGHIDVTKPMHFIGHSAGGFVTGDAAYWLKRWNVATVSRVTMLDTPIPDRIVFTTLMNPTVMERYVSSAGGALAPDLGELPAILSNPFAFFFDPNAITQLSNPLAQGTYYRRQILANFYSSPTAGANVPTISAHSYSHDWYINSAYGVTAEGGGFELSPFMTGQTFAPSGASFAGMNRDEGLTGPSTTSVPLTGFTTFGNVTGTGSPYVLTEDTNAGIQQTMTLPIGAESLQFRYQFTTPGDGDFIAVYFGDNPPLFIGPDVPDARTAPMQVSVPLQGYEGQSGNLVIKLVSQGQINAVAQLDQIELTTTDDPDYDGLTIAEEELAGTNPLLFDTDGDGISDWDEVNTTLTNPLLADSDGDGMSDAQEIKAGTNATNANSVFATTGTARSPTGDFTITWAAKSGKTYRVQRSDTPYFADYIVVGGNIAGVEPTTSFTDNTVPPGTDRMFYRVEVQ